MHDSPGTMRRYVPAGHRNAGVCFSAPHGGLTLHLSAPLALQALCMRAHIYACWLVRREDTRVRRHPRGLVFGGWRHPPPAHNPRCLSYCTAQPSHHTAASAPSSSASTSSNPHTHNTQVEAPGVAAAIYHIFYVLRAASAARVASCSAFAFRCSKESVTRCFPLQQGERAGDARLSQARAGSGRAQPPQRVRHVAWGARLLSGQALSRRRGLRFVARVFGERTWTSERCARYVEVDYPPRRRSELAGTPHASLALRADGAEGGFGKPPARKQTQGSSKIGS